MLYKLLIACMMPPAAVFAVFLAAIAPAHLVAPIFMTTIALVVVAFLIITS